MGNLLEPFQVAGCNSELTFLNEFEKRLEFGSADTGNFDFRFSFEFGSEKVRHAGKDDFVGSQGSCVVVD